MPVRYHILYRGERLQGVTDAQLREGLAQLFKASDTVLDQLLSGRPQLVKRDCDVETAEHYREAMAKVGAVAILQVAEDRSALERTEADSLSLAEPGTPVLDSQERRERRPAAVSLPDSGLTLSPKGTDFSDCRRPETPPPNMDLSSLSLAPEGLPLTETRHGIDPTPAPPDTTHLSLVPEPPAD